MKFQPSNEKQQIIPEIFGEVGNFFLEHLELTDNDRVLFSGMFGIGKTTFLNHFFEQTEIKKKYNIFHLYPVNYSVLSNDDIFKYIKYDILYQMLERKLLQNKSNLDFLNDEPSFVRNNLGNITSLLLLLIPKMGKQLYQLKEEIQKLHKAFLNFKVEDDADENEAINNLINSYNKSDGELHEFNVVTKIIHSKLYDLRQAGKENILIIDDLDRIDPKHVFRLFNVFAAHFDTKNDDKNKFGFDKIIFVCDVKNVRNIYSHVYGIKTDFNGYIDKYYSREVFHFDNIKNIQSLLKNLFEKITFLGDSKSHTEYLNKNKFLVEIMVLVFSNFLVNGEVNLRDILKNYNKEYKLTNRLLYFNNRKSADWRYSFFHTIRVISTYFVDVESLLNSISNSTKNFSHYDFDEGHSLDYLYGEAIQTIRLINPSHNNSESDTNWSYTVEEYTFECEKKKGNFQLNIESCVVNKVSKEIENHGYKELSINQLNYFVFLKKAVESLRKIGYLK